MSIRTLPPSSAWTGDFRGMLEKQYDLLGLARPSILSSLLGAQARPELLLFFGEQLWAPNPALQAELTTYAMDAKHLLPVIDEAAHAVTHLPAEVRAFNAFSRSRHGASWLEALVDEVLTLTWQRRTKRCIFISYRRADAEAVARQLYERYTQRSFDVFLDDVTIQRGVNFQAELRRWIDDADAVLLLISPNIADSAWVREEIERAKTRRVGLLGIIWPQARFGAAGDPAAAAAVPADRRLRLDNSTLALTGSAQHPEQQELNSQILPDVDHLLFTGRSQAVASRLRDLVDVARNELEAEFALRSVSADGDIVLQHKVDNTSWFARVVPFRPEITDLWTWWREQRDATPTPEGLLVVYPELDPNEDQAIALRELGAAWGVTLSPRLRLHRVRV